MALTQPPMRPRLQGCFRAVFPDARLDAVEEVTMDRLTEWDSVNQAILLATIEDEFGIAIAPERYADLRSFLTIEEHLAKECGRGA